MKDIAEFLSEPESKKQKKGASILSFILFILVVVASFYIFDFLGGLYVFALPIFLLIKVAESNISILIKMFPCIILGWISLLSITLIPIFPYMLIKYVWKFVGYLVERSKTAAVTVCTILVCFSLLRLCMFPNFDLSSVFVRSEDDKSSDVSVYTMQESSYVYITPFGEKYHTPQCRYSESAIKTTVSEAQEKGYTPCAICKPERK